MPHVQIEMDRGAGWEARSSGDISGKHADIVAQVLADLPRYAIRYPHRAWVDDVMVGECEPVRRKRSE